MIFLNRIWLDGIQLNNSIFIDQDPTIFAHVLNLLRCENYIVPSNCIDNVSIMADYFGIRMKQASELIIIDCGGTIFKTDKSTLVQIDFFKSARWNSSSNSIFIDQDPTIFVHVLNLLRCEDYIVPSNCIDNVSIMADYFGIKMKLPIEKKLRLDIIEYKYNSTRNSGSYEFHIGLNDCHSILDINLVLLDGDIKSINMICPLVIIIGESMIMN